MDSFEQELSRKLVADKLISGEAVQQAVAECESLNCSLLSCLLSKGQLPEDVLLTVIASITGLSYLDLKSAVIDDAAVKAVPSKFAWYYEFMPVKLEGNKLTIAVASPLSLRIQDEIRFSLRHDLAVVLSKKEYIIERLKEYYGLGSDTVERMVAHGEQVSKVSGAAHTYAIDEAGKMAEDASVIKLVNQIVLDAYRRRATDIHIEPFRDKLRLRYRVDGVLRDQNVPENFRHFVLPILSRLKIMANLDISERRIPQDGKTSVRTQDQVLDLRLSFIPTPHGESVVIRILPRKMFYSLESLGLSKDDLNMLEALIKKPSGILFVTGPTGSGKTTTLYACLKKINRVEQKVVTIEDPIEYEIDDVTQIQINPDVGLTFASGLRSMLRHDPDIIMVGEVRDRETADIAIRVALTGHLVMSTIHTNDAATGVTRLVDIGIEPYLVASSVEALIAQRLVRMICPHCKAENKDLSPGLQKDIVENLSLSPGSTVKVYKGAGCSSCNFTGFFGRMAIYEILLVDREIKNLIVEKRPAADIKRQAIKNGMRTLMQNGWLKVIEGLTTPEEIFNVCHDSRSDHDEPKGPPEPFVTDAGAAGQAVIDFENEVAIEHENNMRIYPRAAVRMAARLILIEKGSGDVIKLNTAKGGIKNDLLSKSMIDESPAEKVMDFERLEFGGSSVNMSAGGILLESTYSVPIGSIVEAKFALPGKAETIACLARVTRVEKDLPRCFYIAVCYLDMSGADRSIISRFVKTELFKHKII
ncbi:MAG: ATPase, T2SS/T4P/T4SS family [Candidatus Omnitrophota bacterium]